MAAMWSVIFYTVLAVAAFYFILLQPVLKGQREQRKTIRALRIGDEVVTTGGIIAEVIDVVTPPDEPTYLVLEIAPGVRVRALPDAVNRRLTTLVSDERPSPQSAPKEAPTA